MICLVIAVSSFKHRVHIDDFKLKFYFFNEPFLLCHQSIIFIVQIGKLFRNIKASDPFIVLISGFGRTHFSYFFFDDFYLTFRRFIILRFFEK